MFMFVCGQICTHGDSTPLIARLIPNPSLYGRIKPLELQKGRWCIPTWMQRDESTRKCYFCTSRTHPCSFKIWCTMQVRLTPSSQGSSRQYTRCIAPGDSNGSTGSDLICDMTSGVSSIGPIRLANAPRKMILSDLNLRMKRGRQDALFNYQ